MNKSLKLLIRKLLPRSVRPRRIWSGPLRGNYLVTSWYDYPTAILGRCERSLLDWFTENVKSGETWLDVGAHYGYTAIALARLVGNEGRVIAFEPMLASAGSIARSRVLNNLNQLTIVPTALGQCEDVAALSLPSERGMIDPTTGDRGEKGPDEPFFMLNLDWLWPRISTGKTEDSQRIHGIKIDVQGMEIHVLKGMFRLLERYHPKLVIEIHEGVSRTELLDLLGDAGYFLEGEAIDQSREEPQYADNRSYAFYYTRASRPSPVLTTNS